MSNVARYLPGVPWECLGGVVGGRRSAALDEKLALDRIPLGVGGKRRQRPKAEINLTVRSFCLGWAFAMAASREEKTHSATHMTLARTKENQIHMTLVKYVSLSEGTFYHWSGGKREASLSGGEVRPSLTSSLGRARDHRSASPPWKVQTTHSKHQSAYVCIRIPRDVGTRASFATLFPFFIWSTGSLSVSSMERSDQAILNTRVPT